MSRRPLAAYRARMPHLQFDLNFGATGEEKSRFAAAVIRHFAEVMDTGTDHIGVMLRTHDREALAFGRAAEGDGRIVFLNADIRLGRTPDQRRRLALAIIAEAGRTWGVAERSVYVVYTEHDGEHFQLSDRVLPSWTPGEDPLADAPLRAKARPARKASRAKGARAAAGPRGVATRERGSVRKRPRTPTVAH